VLAEELQRANTVSEALAAHAERRFPRCKAIVENSVQIGNFQINQAPPPKIFGLMQASSAVMVQPY
jgi:hypothetical protein